MGSEDGRMSPELRRSVRARKRKVSTKRSSASEAFTARYARANPAIVLYHDLGASPKGVLQTVEGLLHYYSGVADLVDGIEIWSQDMRNKTQ